MDQAIGRPHVLPLRRLDWIKTRAAVWYESGVDAEPVVPVLGDPSTEEGLVQKRR